MKVTSTSNTVLWHLKKLIFFGLEHDDPTMNVKAVFVGVAAFFCITCIWILLLL